jgi:hypothetical protein
MVFDSDPNSIIQSKQEDEEIISNSNQLNSSSSALASLITSTSGGGSGLTTTPSTPSLTKPTSPSITSSTTTTTTIPSVFNSICELTNNNLIFFNPTNNNNNNQSSTDMMTLPQTTPKTKQKHPNIHHMRTIHPHNHYQRLNNNNVKLSAVNCITTSIIVNSEQKSLNNNSVDFNENKSNEV